MAEYNRMKHVERQERECNTHGRTTFACRVSGMGASKSWKCMLCEADQQRVRAAAKKDGTFEPTYNKHPKVPVRVYAQCKRHFIALNALGKCDDCED